MTKVKLRGSEFRIMFDHKSIPVSKTVKNSAGVLVPMKKEMKHYGTNCNIFEDEIYFAHGETWLNPKDNFCRKTGIKISLARALKRTNFDKYERTVIWNAVLRRGRFDETNAVGGLQTTSEQYERGSDQSQFQVHDKDAGSNVDLQEMAGIDFGAFNERWRRISQTLRSIIEKRFGKGN